MEPTTKASHAIPQSISMREYCWMATLPEDAFDNDGFFVIFSERMFSDVHKKMRRFSGDKRRIPT